MNKIENTKIEKRAIRALEGPIIDSDYLDSSFNSMDKELSWDGYIYVFNEYSCAAEPPVQYRLSHLSRRSEPLINHTICYDASLLA